MAIGTITMILANVGLSIFNNWAGSRQNKQIAEKREEFERAAREGQRDRMLQLMREGQQLTLELEEQKHKERLSELNDQFDNLIKELAYSATIEHWPLKTLPIVMKNQALGNLLAKQEEKVALHCILTPSNCYDFNQYVLPKVESALEEYCNLHWSNLSGNPILFYSGAWNGNDAPTGTQVASLQTALSNLPSLLITPYFRPTDGKLVFQVYTWGVGSNHQDQFAIPVIEPTEFQRDYTNALNWPAEDHLIEDAVEDLVPYLQCMIGYIADTYFWSAFGSVPQLPRMLTDGTINTDGMKYLVDDTCGYYSSLLTTSEKKSLEQPFAEDNLLNLYDGVSVLWDEKMKKNKMESVFYAFCDNKRLKFGNDTSDNLRLLTRKDLGSLKRFESSGKLNVDLSGIIKHLEGNVHCIIEEHVTCNFVDILEWGLNKFNDYSLDGCALQLKLKPKMTIASFLDKNGVSIDDENSPCCLVVKHETLVAPQHFVFKSNTFTMNKEKLLTIYQSIN